MEPLKALREQRGKVAGDIKALSDKLNAENRDFTAEEKVAWDQLNADYDGLTGRIAVAERAQLIESQQIAPAGDRRIGRGDIAPQVHVRNRDELAALAIQAWFRANASRDFPLTEAHEQACSELGFNARAKELRFRLYDTGHLASLQEAFSPDAGPRQDAVRRAHAVALQIGAVNSTLSSITDAAGGAIMPPESMMNQLEIATLAYGGILVVSDIMTTDTRERIRWPTAKDTGNKGRRLGESGATSTTTTPAPTFGEVYFDIYKYTSDEILVPFELLDGSAFQLPAILGSMMGERIGRKLADDLTTGTGANMPKGVVTGAGTASAASATAISWDDLETLISAVDPSYRQGAVFVMHDATRKALKLLKDGMGRPLWADGPNGTEPMTIKGYPWFINQSMDSTISSGKKTVGFGQFKKYKVRRFRDIRIYRLIERYRENDQDAFLAFEEFDGNLVDAGGTPIKFLTH